MDEAQRITWFSGLFEGEGTFAFNKGKPKAMAIQMTDEDILLRVKEYFGGSIHKIKKREEHWKDCWKWTITGSKSVSLAKEILPYLGHRRSLRAIEYIENYSSLEDRKQRALDLRDKVIELHGTGLTHQRIADILGKDRTYITHIINR